MSETDLTKLLQAKNVSPWRIAWARWIESSRIQNIIIAVIIINGITLGLETSDAMMEGFGGFLKVIDRICLLVFICELIIKLTAYRFSFFRNSWNCFDFFVVTIALVPGAGPWAVLRSLRILRILRLITVVPQLRKVVAAFLHAIPGLSGVILILLIFFYTMAVLATNLFGSEFPEWFGTLGASLYSLFQIMTLEGWSMGIVRPVMDVYPWAWAFFVPFIVVATFTILNLFIGIIVSTMQQLAIQPEPGVSKATVLSTLERIEKDLATLKKELSK